VECPTCILAAGHLLGVREKQEVCLRTARSIAEPSAADWQPWIASGSWRGAIASARIGEGHETCPADLPVAKPASVPPNLRKIAKPTLSASSFYLWVANFDRPGRIFSPPSTTAHIPLRAKKLGRGKATPEGLDWHDNCLRNGIQVDFQDLRLAATAIAGQGEQRGVVA
jgi:hypothetical protein